MCGGFIGPKYKPRNVVEFTRTSVSVLRMREGAAAQYGLGFRRPNLAAPVVYTTTSQIAAITPARIPLTHGRVRASVLYPLSQPRVVACRHQRGSGAVALRWAHSAPGIDRCLLASATIKLASTAKPSPPTRPALMHASTTRSNTVRKTSVLRNRSLRARENAEWSGTLSSIERPQNQR